jgi:hypothetical protein
MKLRQRHPRERDQAHIDYVNKLPCCVCGSTRNVEAAHLKLRLPEVGKVDAPGMQMKEDDRWVTPLCNYHHLSGILAQHRVGEQRFWFEIHGRNPFEIAASLWIESGGAARAAELAENPKPVKPRKIKPRDRTKPKRQIPARELQSRSAWPVGRKMQSRNSFEKRTPTSC